MSNLIAIFSILPLLVSCLDGGFCTILITIMHSLLFSISILCILILLFVALLKKLRQPYLVAYILTGVVMGPHVMALFPDTATIAGLGDIGILLMMFFLGMEMDIPDNRSMLAGPLAAQAIKTLLGIACACVIARWLHWNTGNTVLLTIIFIFNSTAVVADYLQKNGELNSRPGKTILNVLLLQDIMLAPVLTILQFLGQGTMNYWQLASSVAACAGIFYFLRSIRNKSFMQLPFAKELEQDHDLQVFAGAFTCFGIGLIMSAMGLTASFGSFIAGIFLSRTNAFHWLDRALKPFKIFFVALFFVSVGLRIDLGYVCTHLRIIVVVTVALILMNSLLSAIVFRLLRYPARASIYAGALLSQTGEFSLLACSLAYQSNIIDASFYKMAMTVTCLSLLFSTTWITLLRKFIYRDASFFAA